MQLKTFTVSIAIAKLAALVSADVSASNYYNSLTSQINPKNISIPSLTQTSSHDVTAECTYYVPDTSLITINNTEFPTIWQKATTNGMNTSAEFTSLYNSIDWTKAPNISVRTFTSAGGLDTTGYSASTDPDCWWSASTCTIPKHDGINADIYRCDEPETWGLTYDDGPNCSHNAFYDYLQEKSLKASMFYIGSNVLDWPYGAMRGVKDGHHIASHTWSHPYMTTLTNKEVLAELYFTQKAIKLATGLTPRYWRPPYGDVDDRVRWIASQLGLTAIIWNLDTDDWEAGTGTTTVQDVEQTYQNFVNMGTNGTFANSGNIVLTHEINNTTMSMALDYLPKITAAYKQVIDVATCANISHPYFEDFEWTNVLNGTNSSSSASSAAASGNAVSGASSVVPSVALVGAFALALLF
ncbi:chitin deacetylase [Gilbertella persicaria]|uniref:chitin deacetylase n=1 Tax=Gilbertella persicaria TaxID=101096 RepID=UPI002220416B|nr:chitin deacetylase [Gilbertella persicaria]KAI8092220.1 chitin deacetylase [Gilbertella persicaria]